MSKDADPPWPAWAISLEPYNAAYVEIAKVASSSIKLALAPLIGVEISGGDPHRARWPTVPLATVPGDRAVFAFVRNPWDRLLSCYRDKVGGEPAEFTHFDLRRGVANCLAQYDAITPGMPFDQFVEVVVGIDDRDADEHFRSQHTFLGGTGHMPTNIIIGRQENLEADWEQLLERTGLPDVRLQRRQAAPSAVDYKHSYDAVTRSLVGDRYKVDIELFEYAF